MSSKRVDLLRKQKRGEMSKFASLQSSELIIALRFVKCFNESIFHDKLRNSWLHNILYPCLDESGVVRLGKTCVSLRFSVIKIAPFPFKDDHVSVVSWPLAGIVQKTKHVAIPPVQLRDVITYTKRLK